MLSEDTYAQHWDPATVSDAMKLIVLRDDDEFFEQSGKQTAADLLEVFPAGSPDVVDLGCGIGRIARHVAPHCGHLVLVDISPRMLEIARERLGRDDSGNVSFALSEPSGIPALGDDTADVVYSVLVLQHVEREDAFCLMRDVRRVLRPGGVAYLTFPNLLADEYLASFVHYAETGEVTNSARARFYTPSEVRRLTTAAGFSDVVLLEGTEIVAICR